MSKTFHIVTFGCQMNKLDSELLAGELLRRGFEPARQPERADVLIYNTCSVRQHAEDRVLSHLGSWRKRAEHDPRFILGVTGCMAQRLGEEIADRFRHVRLVCGTRAFLKVPDFLDQIAANGQRIVALQQQPLDTHRLSQARPEKHRAYVSITRGCDNYCAYCIVPYVRGREVSRPPHEILDELKRLCDDGVVEVTLLGQNVDSYGKGLGRGVSLAGLLEQVNSLGGLRRVRFITSHPKDMTQDILRAVGELDKVCEHIHMPAQSGSDAVLERMNRGYTRRHYLELVARGRQLIPGVEFSSDFLVGFPGETERDFDLTLSLLIEVGFQQSFIFKYSSRPGTRAARLPDDVPDAAKRERNQRLLAAQQRVDAGRRADMVGSIAEVMVKGPNEGDPACGQLMGRTRQNDIVIFSGADSPPGTLCRVRIDSSTPLTLFGRCLT